MSKEILLVVESVSNEKGVPEEIIFDALEVALATATKKRYSEESDVRVAIDRETGLYDSFRRWTVMADDEPIEFEDAQLTIEQAGEMQPGLAAGDIYEIAIDSVELPIEKMNADIHASAEYRAHLVKVMTKRAVEACA